MVNDENKTQNGNNDGSLFNSLHHYCHFVSCFHRLPFAKTYKIFFWIFKKTGNNLFPLFLDTSFSNGFCYMLRGFCAWDGTKVGYIQLILFRSDSFIKHYICFTYFNKKTQNGNNDGGN